MGQLIDTLLVLLFGFVIGGWVAADKGIGRDQFYALFLYWLLLALIYSLMVIVKAILARRKEKDDATLPD